MKKIHSDRSSFLFGRYKVLWCALLLGLILNAIAYIWIVKPQYGELARLQTIYKEARGLKHVDADNQFDYILRAKQDVKVFLRRLSPVVAIVNNVRELKAILNRRNLSVTRMVFTPERIEEKSLVKYSCNFTITGSYFHLKGFLVEIQKSPTLYCIESLSLVNRSDDTELIDLKITLATYYTTNA